MRVKTRVLKFIDFIIGKPLIYIISFILKDNKKECKDIKKILVIRPGGIGDATLLHPFIKELREIFRNKEIHLLAEKRNYGILTISPYIDKIFLYDKMGDMFRLLKEDYDIIIDTEQWHRLSAILSYVKRAPKRIGFATNDRVKLLTDHVGYSHTDYEVHSFFNLLRLIKDKEFSFNPDEPFIFISDDLKRWAESLLEGVKHNKIVAIFPGASIKERKWGADKFLLLAKRLANERINIVVVGGREEYRIGEMIEKSVNGLNFAGFLSLSKTSAIISQVDALVTGDSGIMHIAYGVGTPTVSLFGPGIKEKWGPKGKKHRVIFKELPCSPCTIFGYTPRCKKDIKCMDMISVDEVTENVMEVLYDSNSFRKCE